MSRFPKISETFVLYEILEIIRMGYSVEVFPLIREREGIVHPEAQPIVDQAHYSKPFGRKILAAHAYWLRRRPRIYLQTLAGVIAANIGSPKFLARALIVLLQAAWFAREMERLGVTHVHAHFATHPALAAYVVKRLAGISYSFTVHADDIYTQRPMLAEKIRQARQVVSISDYNRRFLERLYGDLARAKVTVVHCGVDVGVFAPRPAPAPRAEFHIACVARMEEKKGHTYLLDACAHLRDRGVPVRCHLIGDGELRPEVEAQIARLNLGEVVELHGRQPRGRVKELLAAADVMVLPSITTAEGRQEGIPVALMEAMATELPVVSTRTSGIPELIEHGRSGLLVPERDAEALTRALLLLATNRDLGPRLGAAGRARVLAEFDLRENARMLSRILTTDLAAPLDTVKLERAF